MPGMSKHLATMLYNLTLNPSRGQIQVSPPDSIFLALHSSAPDDQSYGGEASYGGYARVSIESLTAEVIDVGGGEFTLRVTNNLAVTFPESTGPEETCTHWAIWDAQAKGDGNILYSGALSSARLVSTGDAVVVAQGDLVLDIF